MKFVSLSTRLGIITVFVCLTFITFVANTHAQASRSISTVGRRLDDFNRQSERAERDELAREMEGRKLSPEERRKAEIKKTQIRDDLESLQATYNDVVARLQAKEELSSTYVAELTEKVSKSCVRLRSNIAFPPLKSSDAKTGRIGTPQQASIESLCINILAFLTNPIFESGVLDLIETEKARDTLDKIIQTSEELRHRLGRTH